MLSGAAGRELAAAVAGVDDPEAVGLLRVLDDIEDAAEPCAEHLRSRPHEDLYPAATSH